jgi:hypothetical protein
MNDYEILRSITQIDRNNQFLEYIVNRIVGEDYRGYQCSQHNRLTYDYFKSVILSIYKIVGEEQFYIHVGDDEGERQIEAERYYNIVELIRNESGKGTINSIKKNTFPDIARMGFLCRYNRKNELINDNIEGTKKSRVYSVQLSTMGIRFAKEKLEFNRRKWFTEGIDNITKNTSSELVELFSLDDNISQIDILEYMYIMSDNRINVSFKDKIEYLFEYRKLTDVQKQKVTELLKKYCDPDKRYSKIDKRDYGNWKNESQQIFGLLANTTYFKVLNNTLMLNDNKSYGLFAQVAKRKQSSKNEYYKHNGIKKQKGYELHHIIPFAKASNQKDAELIDDQRNLIYLEETKHSEFTNSNNVNICVSYNKPIISFLKVDDINEIINVNIENKEALLSEGLIPQMKEYNERLLRKFYQVSN